MRHVNSIFAALGGLATLAAFSVAAVAEETPRQNRQAGAAAAKSEVGRLDEKTSMQAVRASTLIGINIQNPKGESLGEIHDLVIDADQRKVHYAAVTYGGFLGLGDKLFAVPFEAFRCRTNPEDASEVQLVLDVTQQQLEGARGFDEENWPNFADPTFAKDLNDRYDVERNRRLRGAEVKIDGRNVDVTLKATRRGSSDTDSKNGGRLGRLDAKTHAGMVRASQLMGHNIQNSAQESVGEIHDLVIDGRDGKLRYAAVTYGGFLGLGDKLFAVPFDAFECRRSTEDPDEHVLTLNVTQKQLEGAKGFDQDNWPNFADREFAKELDRRYGVNVNVETTNEDN